MISQPQLRLSYIYTYIARVVRTYMQHVIDRSSWRPAGRRYLYLDLDRDEPAADVDIIIGARMT